MSKVEPDYKGFTRAIMQFWPWGDVDGIDLQEVAIKYGMLSEIEGALIRTSMRIPLVPWSVVTAFLRGHTREKPMRKAQISSTL